MWQHFVEIVRKQLENQFLSGGLILVFATGFLTYLRNVPRMMWDFFKRRFVTTIDIADHDPAFYWVQKWLSTQDSAKKSRTLTASTRQSPYSKDGSPVQKEDGARRKRNLMEVVFSPAPGRHLLWYKKMPILMTRTRSDPSNAISDFAYHESFTFQTFSKSLVHDLIFEAREMAFPLEDTRIAIFRPTWSSWKIVQRRLPRSLESVVLEKDIGKEMHGDMLWFFGAESWYAKHGIPYQRGYLLVGPPGNGKTSLVVALASVFDRDIYIVNLSSMGDNTLATLMGDLPEQALVLIEDVDAIFQEREKADGNDKLTFSGFINAIDGVSAPPGRVLFMTTNHPEKLDGALTRAGRMDRIFEFSNATPGQALRLFMRFFPEAAALGYQFEARIANADRECAMADIQEHMIKYRGDPITAATTVPVPRAKKTPHTAVPSGGPTPV